MARNPWQADRVHSFELVVIYFIRRTVTLALCLKCIVSTVVADETEAVKEAIRRHSEAVAQIRSYHLKIETHSSHLQDLPDSSSLRCN